jgi:hypothetical protein
MEKPITQGTQRFTWFGLKTTSTNKDLIDVVLGGPIFESLPLQRFTWFGLSLCHYVLCRGTIMNAYLEFQLWVEA